MNWFPGRTPSPPRHCTALTGSVRRRSTSICSPPCVWWRGISVKPSRAPEVIQHQNAALPSELFAAAVYFQAGRTPAEVSGLAKEGRLMGFFGPGGRRSPAGLRPAPLWVRAGTAVLHHGLWALQSAACLEAGHHIRPETGISATQAMARLTMDQPGLPKARRAPLYPGRPGLRAHRGVVPDLVSLRPPWPPISPVMRIWVSQRWPIIRCGWSGVRVRRPCSRRCKKCWILRAHCGMLCAYQKKGRERTMNHQRKQSMHRDSVEGRLPLWKPAFSIRMTLAAK